MQRLSESSRSDTAAEWTSLHRPSGLLLIATALVWTVVTWTARALYASGYPDNPAAYLHLISQHQALAATTWTLWILSDLLLIAPTVLLFVILKRSSLTLALLGSMLSMFFNVYDVCVTELNSLTLVGLAHGYASAPTDAVKDQFVAAAAYGYYALPIQTVLSFAVGTIGYLLWCIPMLRSQFRRGTAVFGAVVMIVALIGSTSPLFPGSVALGLCQLVCVPACAVWFVLVGMQLIRHKRLLHRQ